MSRHALYNVAGYVVSALEHTGGQHNTCSGKFCLQNDYFRKEIGLFQEINALSFETTKNLSFLFVCLFGFCLFLSFAFLFVCFDRVSNSLQNQMFLSLELKNLPPPFPKCWTFSVETECICLLVQLHLLFITE